MVQLPEPPVGWNVPTGHVSHAVSPTPLLDVPAVHSVHTNPSHPNPVGHLQSVDATLPGAELLSNGHAVQLPDPAVAL